MRYIAYISRSVYRLILPSRAHCSHKNQIYCMNDCNQLLIPCDARTHTSKAKRFLLRHGLDSWNTVSEYC